MADEAKTVSELRTEAQTLAEEIERLGTLPEPTDEEIELLARAVEQSGPLADSIRQAELEERKQNLETIRQFAARPEQVIATGPELVVRNKRDPYDLSEMRFSLPGESRSEELRERARDAVEQAPEWMSDDQREQATRHLDRDESGEVAVHYLAHGSRAYTDNYLHYMRTGEKRASMSTTGANGGFLIPFHLDPSVILTSNGSVNPFRQIASVETITSNTWHGVSSAGVSAEWTSEASEWTDASPTFSQPTIPTYKADAYVSASFEVTQDSSIVAQLGEAFAEAKDTHEDTAFTTGTGTNQPTGIITAINGVTASRVSVQTNAEFGAVDVFALVNALPAKHQRNPAWVGHWSIFNLIRQFGGANQPNFWVDLGPGIPSQLLGQSAYVASGMQAAPLSTATASTDEILILGNFSRYKIVDRIGIETVYNPLVIGTNHRPTGQVGWGMYWRVGADTVDANAFRLLVA